jgi:predicted outer membrane repeat protein
MLLIAVFLGILSFNGGPASAMGGVQNRRLAEDTTSPSRNAHVNNISANGCLNPVTVTNANDDGAGSLRQAVAEVCAEGTITFAASYSIYLESSLSLTSTVTIDGSGQTVTISGDSGNDGSRNVRPFTIAASGVVTLTQLTIVDGTATDGGAINSSGALTVRASTFARNFAPASGGAIFAGGGTLTVDQSTFLTNTAGINGGAVWVESTTVLITNSTFADNSATNGGGLTSYSADTTVTHATFSGNGATTGSDIRRVSGTLRLRNSLLANSTTGANCSGDLTTNTNNLIEDSSCSPAIASDPLLTTLGNYGGTTQTFGLLPGSPAIDAVTGANCLAIDQRSITRPAACDIGAFESRGFTLSIAGGNNQTATLNSAFPAPLAVLVVANAAGEPVGSGGMITWSGPASGASISPALVSSSTTAGGSVSASVLSNSTAGSYTVTATARGANEVSFTLTQLDIRSTIFLPLLGR